MSTHRINYEELQHYYEKLFLDYVDSKQTKSKNKLLSRSQYDTFIFGPVIEKYKEKDSELLQLISHDFFDIDIVNVVMPSIEQQIREYECKSSLNIIDEKLYELALTQYDMLLKGKINQWLKEYFQPNMSAFGLSFEKNQIRGFCLVLYGYRVYYRKNMSIFNSDSHVLKELYKKVYFKDSALFTYNLIEVVNDCELMPIDPPRLYDKRIDKTIMVSHIKKELLEVFRVLRMSGFIENLYVRLSNSLSQIYNGRYTTQSLMEEKEFGQLFSIKQLTSVPVTKLYSKKYENALWINISGTDITFEELCENEEIIDNSIITQVIHLKYKQEKDAIIISHIDHEFIFYDKKEYIERKAKSNIKGTKHKRLKSFKIDNSSIPFNHLITRKVSLENNYYKDEIDEEEKVPFLVFVLKCYFRHHELIVEYFQGIT